MHMGLDHFSAQHVRSGIIQGSEGSINIYQMHFFLLTLYFRGTKQTSSHGLEPESQPFPLTTLPAT